MGFPTWTLWGMVISAVMALILLGYSLYSQARGARAKLTTEPYRLERRIRRLTAGAFAALLLMFGFFVAGVPTELVNYAVTGSVPTETVATDDVALASVDSSGDSAETVDARSESGAFGGPPPETETEVPSDSAIPTPSSDSFAVTPPGAESESDAAPLDTPVPTANQTEEITPTATPTPAPTATPTPTPTATPVPTLTPTPIEDPTGIINTGGSTLWVRRSPGGGNLTIVNNGDTVILRTGHANQAGIQWHEIMTVDGVTGWVQLEFLDIDA